MFKSLPFLSLVCILALGALPFASAQDSADNPSIAILQFGGITSLSNIFPGFVNTMQTYGLISDTERATLRAFEDLDGEHISVSWQSADNDIATAAVVLETALDEEPDVLITVSAPMTQLAVSATEMMDDPPLLLFAAVYNPYLAGIADAPCIKPDHVWGVESITPYEDLLPILLSSYPDVTTLGLVHGSGEASGIYGADTIERIAGEMGLEVLRSAVSDVTQLQLAALGLIERGANALITPLDHVTAIGLPVLVNASIENQIPVFYPAAGGAMPDFGATVAAGFGEYFDQGAYTAAMLSAYLNGEVDIAATALTAITNLLVVVNLDTAAEQDIEVAQEVIDQADAVYADGGRTVSQELLAKVFRTRMVQKLEDRQESDQALIASLQCTPEIIAEQQAALDAAE